jgi:Co/Zn/Cd efflux system component
MRAAVIHVVADAAVSVLVIVGLLLARAFGWLWMDPLAGIIGACYRELVLRFDPRYRRNSA